MMDAGEGIANTIRAVDYISVRYNSEVWRIPFESSTGTYIFPEQDGDIAIKGMFVKLILPRQYTQLSPAALGVKLRE